MGTARAAQVTGVALVILISGCGALGASEPVPARGTLALGELPARGNPVDPAGPRGGVTRVAVAAPVPAPVGADGPVPIGGAASASEGAEREPGPEPHDLTLAFTGDTLMHRPLVERAARDAGGHGYDFGPMFARIAPLIGAADLAVCHLETPIAPPGEALSTAPLYGVPAEVVTGIAGAGYDRCSTASNHTLDRGTAGIDTTIAALTAAGLGQSGMASEPAGIQPHLFTVDGVQLSHLSYTYGFNGIPLPSGQPWRSALIDPARIVADATSARAMGAQLVIVSLHWGTEGLSGVTPQQRAVAEAITGSGQIDLVVGHHAHVLQPIEQVNGVWVIYGLSNLVSNLGEIDGWPPGAADGAIAEVRFVAQDDGRYLAEPPIVQPTWVDAPAGWVVRPVLADLHDPTVPEGVRARLQASLDRTTAVLGAYLPAA
jgi:poly-gamma-glutamate synthesis protein (capsule biosynthesis protein)